jgi:glycine cleavage system transcriptional repressor
MTENSQNSTGAPTASRPGLVLTAVGPDRPGLVKDVAGHIRKWGGNIEDTRMSKLGGEFAFLALITGQDSALHHIKESIPQLEVALGVACFCKSTATGPAPAEGTLFDFEASGVDHPGIVEAITDAFASRSINVTSLSSRIENAPLTGTPTFILEAQVHVPESTSELDLTQSLSAVCERENLEFSLKKALP